MQVQSYVLLRQLESLHGWFRWEVNIDKIFSVWMAATFNAFPDCRGAITFELFVDYSAEIPLFFFVSEYDMGVYVLRNTNHYPIDRQMYWMRFHPHLWFGTCAQIVIDDILIKRSSEHLRNLRQRLCYY